MYRMSMVQKYQSVQSAQGVASRAIGTTELDCPSYKVLWVVGLLMTSKIG